MSNQPKTTADIALEWSELSRFLAPLVLNNARMPGRPMDALEMENFLLNLIIEFYVTKPVQHAQVTH